MSSFNMKCHNELKWVKSRILESLAPSHSLVKRIKLMLPSLSNNECRNNKTVKYQNVAIAKYQNHIKPNVRCQIWINTNER